MAEMQLVSNENLGTAEDLTLRPRSLAGRSPRRPPEAGGAGAWSRPLQARPGDLESYARRGGMILEDHCAKLSAPFIAPALFPSAPNSLRHGGWQGMQGIPECDEARGKSGKRLGVS